MEPRELKISELDETTEVDSLTVIPVVYKGYTKKISLTTLSDFLGFLPVTLTRRIDNIENAYLKTVVVGETSEGNQTLTFTYESEGEELTSTIEIKPNSVINHIFASNGTELSIANKGVTLSKGAVGLGNVDNTADKDKNVNSAVTATKDSIGNTISDYIKTITINGTSVTILRGNGAESVFNTQDTTYDIATTIANGLMSKEDKIKLDGIEAGAQKNTVTGIKGNAETSYRIGNVNLTPENIGAVGLDQKGKAGGVAELDSTGKVPSSQLPAFIDDVIEGTISEDLTKFYVDGEEVTPEKGKIYVDTATNKTYRWGSTKYVVISDTIALGETSSTAYRGDRGKIAYDHSQLTSGNPHKVTKNDVGLGNVDNTADANKVVAEAGKATNDANGDKIDTTYLKSTDASTTYVQKSGDTMTGLLAIDGSSDELFTLMDKGVIIRNSDNIQLSLGVDTTMPTPYYGLYSDTLNKWMVYASGNNIYLNGNANTATKATQDSSGNNIVGTYSTKANTIRALSISGKTITYTKDDNSTGTLTTQDTTYTGSNGITLTGTNFTNSGVRAIESGDTNGTIKVNTNGTYAEVSVAGLGSAAYTDSGAYLAADGTAVAAEKATKDGDGNEITKKYVTLDTEQTISGAKTFSKSSGFTYSGIETATTNIARNVWFAHSSKPGTPVINDNFKYNPSTNTLTVGTVVGNLTGTADKATKDSAGNTITAKYVTLDTEQTISGNKTLSGTFTYSGIATNSDAIEAPIWFGSKDSNGTPSIDADGLTFNPSTNTLTATTIKGNLSGTAEKATADASGNVITSTYETKANAITGLSASGKTITITKGNGDTSTITTQDTTYDVVTTEKNGLMSSTMLTKLNGIATGAQVNKIEKIQKNGTDLTITDKTVNITVPTKTSEITNDSNFAVDSSYVHTDNNYTTTEKNKLSNIAAGAQVNVIETVKVNGTALTVTNKAVDVTVPTNNNQLTNGAGYITGITKSDVTTALGYTPVDSTKLGVASGVATLDTDGKVPSTQLPSYVDDVVEYESRDKFPTTGESGKIYVDVTNTATYRWSGTTYVMIGSSLTLGETSVTAYRGDYGKIAYAHSQLTSGNPHNVTKSDLGLGNVDNTADANKNVNSAVKDGSGNTITTTYLTKTDAGTTYLTKTDASSTYLTQTNATNTYLTKTDASSTYLTKTDATSTYLTQETATNDYLKKTDASSTYLTQTNAASTYLTQAAAKTGYVTIDTAQTIIGVKTFSTTGGFNYSGIGNGTADATRNVWFSDNSVVGTPVKSENFKYNPSTNILTAGTYLSTAAKFNMNDKVTMQYNSTDEIVEFIFA